MGTLYIVGAPVTGPDDLTIRARRILGNVELVLAGKLQEAHLFLASCAISTPLAPAARHDLAFQALAAGDVALLVPGSSPVPGPIERRLMSAALTAGFAVIPVPGPVAPLTALVLSGLSADSFVYIGLVPGEAGARRSLLASLASEGRTLVLLAGAGELPGLLSLLHRAWGDRPLVLWPLSASAGQEAWRGSLEEGRRVGEALDAGQEWILVAGGAAQASELPWDEDRLRVEIRAHLGQGLGVGQISRELAAPSGWPRREVYRLAVEESQ
jgi:16S rRNA (cytidine1402-2'-O)-methyltransferase